MAGEWPPKSFVPPPSVREIGANAGSAESRQTIDNAQAQVNGFLHAQRQHVASSTLGYHRSSFSSPDLDVYYTNQNGAEKIEYDAHPPIAAAIADAIEAEGVDPPYDTPPYPTQPDAVSTKAYLMVLFGTKGIAAFDMGNLSASGVGDPVFIGTSSGSTWGTAMPVGQYQLGGIGWILTPTDLVNGTTSTKMRLSTTKLTDQVATQASTDAIPIANGGSTVLTVGGAFIIDAKSSKITQASAMALDGGEVVQPTAIDTDGTSYFFPAIIGYDVVVQLDGNSTSSGYGSSASFQAAVATKVTALQQSIPNPLVTSVSLLDTSTVYYPTQGNQQIESIDATGEVCVVTYGTFVHLSFQNGVSYYGKGDFGKVPTPQNVKLSQSARVYEVYDLASNQTQLKTTPVGNNDYSNLFPLQTYVYDPSKTNDTLGVGFPNISAQTDQSQPLTLLMDQDGYGIIGSNFGGASGFTYTGGGQTVSNETVSVGFSANYEVAYPSYSGSTADDAKNFYATCKGVALGAPNLIGSNTIKMVEFLQSNDPPGSIMAQWLTAADAPWPQDTISGTTGQGGTITGASSYNHPFSHGNIEQDLHRNTTVSAFGRSLTYDYVRQGDTGGTQTTTAKPPAMNVHAFPPAFDTAGGVAKPYFNSIELNSSQQLACTCYTPYGTYPQSAGVTEPFKYWLHISNAKHVIQGYFINGIPHAFLDGSTSPSFLAAVATGCKCAQTDIKAMFMDISLDAVKGVTNVRAASYTGTAAPPLTEGGSSPEE